jgi:hypothetical protein
MITKTVPRRWADELAIVCAPGPSLTDDVAALCRGRRAIAVGNAYKAMPWADVVYHTDGPWWRMHNGCPGFSGRCWSSHDDGTNNKSEIAKEYGLRLVAGENGNEFSLDPRLIRYGGNSLFAAVNLAILFGAARIILVGADMRHVNGLAHFDGDHPKPLRQCSDYTKFAPAFDAAAKALPAHISIVNATPGSALKAFPIVSLEDALELEPA